MEQKEIVAKQRMSLEEFEKVPMPEAWVALQRHGTDLFKECQSFTECHIRVQEETGIWIEELVPVFQKLDASLAKVR